MSEDRLAQVTLKIDRAKRHVGELEHEIRRFLDTAPYRVGTKREPQSHRLIYYLTNVSQTPQIIPLIAGDAFQNLVSALDHLAYELVRVGTNDSPPNPNAVYFPIADDVAKYESSQRRKLQGAREDAIDAIDTIKPYKGGNDQLWILYRLNNIDKHRQLITAGSMYRSVNVGALMSRSMAKHLADIAPGETMPQVDLFLRPADTLFPLKEGDELFTDLPDAEVHEKMQFQFDVALAEPQVVEARPLLETVNQLVGSVEGVISAPKTYLE